MMWFEKIREGREARGLSQGALAKLAGVSQQTINKIEQGQVAVSRSTPKIARALGIPIEELDPTLGAELSEIRRTRQIDTFRTAPDELPLYGAAEGGPGIMIVEKAPVAWIEVPEALKGITDAYAVLVVGDSMVPEYRPGDELHIHPRMPKIPDSSYVFYTGDGADDRATVKHLVRITETEWIVLQHNPPREIHLSRAEWPVAHRIVGKKNRR